MNCNSFSLSLPFRWQMSSPVGGYLHRKIQQTSCQKLNRCLWISNIKFKSFLATELFMEKNGLSFSLVLPRPQGFIQQAAGASGERLGYADRGKRMGWMNPQSEPSDVWCKRRKKEGTKQQKKETLPLPLQHCQGEACSPLCQAPPIALYADKNILSRQTKKLLNTRKQHSLKQII